MIDIELISPKVHDRYSPALYEWMKHKRQRDFMRKQVFWHPVDGQPDSWSMRSIIIGRSDDDKWVSGRHLFDIMNELRGVKTESFAYAIKNWSLVEITDQFWTLYQRIGRCLIDPNHRIGFVRDDSRYTVIGSTRRCNWCGEWHEQSIIKEVSIERRLVWKKQGMKP